MGAILGQKRLPAQFKTASAAGGLSPPGKAKTDSSSVSDSTCSGRARSHLPGAGIAARSAGSQKRVLTAPTALWQLQNMVDDPSKRFFLNRAAPRTHRAKK